MLLLQGAPQERAGTGKGESGQALVSHLNRALLTAAASHIQNNRAPGTQPSGARSRRELGCMEREGRAVTQPPPGARGRGTGQIPALSPGQPRIAPREAVSRGLHTREQPPPPVQGLQHLHDQLQGMQAGAARPGGGCASEAPPSMPDLQGQVLMEPAFEALRGQLTKGLICLREAALPLECSAWGQRAPWGQGGGVQSIHHWEAGDTAG